jgi:hypothetical protein
MKSITFLIRLRDSTYKNGLSCFSKGKTKCTCHIIYQDENINKRETKGHTKFRLQNHMIPTLLIKRYRTCFHVGFYDLIINAY